MVAKESELSEALQKLTAAEVELAGVHSRLEKGEEMKKKLLAKAKELNKKLAKAEEVAKAARAKGAEHSAAVSDGLRGAAEGMDLQLAMENGAALADNEGEGDNEGFFLKTEVFVEAIGQGRRR